MGKVSRTVKKQERHIEALQSQIEETDGWQLKIKENVRDTRAYLLALFFIASLFGDSKETLAQCN